MVNFTGLHITNEGAGIAKSGKVTTGSCGDGVIYMDGNLDSIYAGGDISWTVSSIWMNDEVEFSLPSPRCSYCGSCGGEDAYHPGTCANCGAIL